MRRAAVLLVAMCLAGGITGVAKADGTIILNNFNDFQGSINKNYISGAGSSQGGPNQQLASNSALSRAFPGQTQADSIAQASSQLNGLLSAASPPAVGGQFVSSWTFGYHIDPDLTNYTINMGLYLPQVATTSSASGINMITVALTSVATDINNQPVYSTRVWGFDNTLTPSILSPDPTTNIENFSLAAVDGAGAGGSNYFNQDSTFDIQNVLYLSIGYRGEVGSTYPLTPLGTTALWMGTESLDVTATPEPNSALVLACSLLGAGLLRFSQRARSRRHKMLAG